MWKIKDPELKRKINQFVSDEEIDRICRCDMMDSFDCIFFSFEDDCVSIRIDKSFFKEIPDYDPNNWNAMEAHVQKLEELLSGELPIYSGC